MRFCRRSWGWWLVLLDRKHFKIKLLRFKNGGKLSKQYHYFRNELWLFLSGPRKGGYSHYIAKEEHTYHAFVPTLILEVQYGEKCSEGDIVRV